MTTQSLQATPLTTQVSQSTCSTSILGSFRSRSANGTLPESTDTFVPQSSGDGAGESFLTPGSHSSTVSSRASFDVSQGSSQFAPPSIFE